MGAEMAGWGGGSLAAVMTCDGRNAERMAVGWEEVYFRTQLREKSEWISRRIFAIDRMPKPKLFDGGLTPRSIDAMTAAMLGMELRCD